MENKNDDLISRQAAIDALERKKYKNAKGDIAGFYTKIIQNDIDTLMQLPPAQPELVDAIKSFDPKTYAYEGDMRYWSLMTPANRNKELQRVSNLIFNMGVIGCSQPELVDAIRYSMVVIDSVKGLLNWKKAKADFHIDELVKKYEA